METGLLGVAAAAFHKARSEPPEHRLGGTRVAIKEVTAKEHNGRSYTPFREIFCRAAQDRELILQFLIPTTFRVRDANFLFPLPQLVFSSLLRHWDAFSGLPLAPCLSGCLDSILVSRYHLETELVIFSGFKAIGFQGYAVYTLPATLSEAQVKALNCLADFAFYCGVGWKTTMGMGQARRLDHAGPLCYGAGSHPQERG